MSNIPQKFAQETGRFLAIDSLYHGLF